MAKLRKNFRLDSQLVKALALLSQGNETSFIETLIFREAIYKLKSDELENLFGEDYERLMLMYAVRRK